MIHIYFAWYLFDNPRFAANDDNWNAIMITYSWQNIVHANEILIPSSKCRLS